MIGLSAHGWCIHNFHFKRKTGVGKNQVTVTVNTGGQRGKIFAMNNEFRSLPGVKIRYGQASGNQIQFELFTVQTKNRYDKAVECYSLMKIICSAGSTSRIIFKPV
jgi:hypothetical protein